MRKKQKGILSFEQFKEQRVLQAAVNGGLSEDADSTDVKINKRENKKKRAAKKKFPSLFWLGERLEIEGFNQTRLLNEFLEQEIKVLELDKKSASRMTAAVGQKDLQKVFAILDKLGYTYSVVKRVSLKTIGQYLLAKVALAVAVLAAFAAGIYGYGYVWRVEFSGYDRIDPALIERHLAENGFGRGVRKSAHDLDELRLLISSLDQMLEATVEIRGTTLRVDIVETTIYFEPPLPNMNGIFSRFDATVTRIEAESGTPQVDIGARVFKGRELIAAHHIDTQGNLHRTPSRGRVYGRVTFTDSVRFRLTENARVPTGNRATYTRYAIFGMDFRSPVTEFTDWDSTAAERYVFENLFIPLRMRQTTFTEMHWVERTFSLDERVEYFNNQARHAHMMHIGSADYELTYVVETISETEFILHTFTAAELLLGA